MVPEGLASGTRRGPFWPWAAVAAGLLGLALTGCASTPASSSPNHASSSNSSTLMGQGFTDNSLGDQVRGYRKPDPDAGFDGVSSKSQQVEKDLGVQ